MFIYLNGEKDIPPADPISPLSILILSGSYFARSVDSPQLTYSNAGERIPLLSSPSSPLFCRFHLMRKGDLKIPPLPLRTNRQTDGLKTFWLPDFCYARFFFGEGGHCSKGKRNGFSSILHSYARTNILPTPAAASQQGGQIKKC